MRAFFLGLFAFSTLTAAEFESKPNDPYFEKFEPRKAPSPKRLLLKKGDRLAICGDSITEQKMYSRIMETYLTVCVPELEVTARQYGWGGETASGFLARMTNDVLRFKPTVATTCYGMNDHGYKAYEEAIGQKYRERSTAIVKAFTSHGCRVIQGSPGCVSKKPEPLNLSLCELRNIGIEVALKERAGFADVFWPMFAVGFEAQQQYGTNLPIAGKDGVHPGWAGHLVMAYAFLKSFGLDGNIGTLTLDLKNYKGSGSPGHKLVDQSFSQFQFESRRYPFCAVTNTNNVDNTRTGMALVPFNQELNRFTLVVKNAKAPKYRVSWGQGRKIYSREELAKGVNLVEDFEVNPFVEAFNKVDKAVKAKQDYETKQVKQIFHGPEGKADMEAAVARTEAEREVLAKTIKTAFVPVRHSIAITPLN